MTIVIPRSASARVLAVAEELPVGEEPPGISRLELVDAPKQVLLPKTLSPIGQIISVCATARSTPHSVST